MCTAVAKYYKGIGWVVSKNRDQDYVSHVSFDDKEHNGVGEILIMRDLETHYSEGMNSKGMAIVTTSLTPNIEDETDKEDGLLIFKALHKDTPEIAASFLINNKLCGFIFIVTPEKFILIEAARTQDGEGKYYAKMRTVPKNEVVCRTNHGVEFAWAGFQYGIDPQQDIWRKSSELRMKQAEQVAKDAENPEHMLNQLAKKMNKDLQMNLFRCENKPRQMRTIFQWSLIPSQEVVIVRPIQCKMKVDVSREHININVLDNEPLKKLYNGRIKHFSKVVLTKDDKYVKTVIQTEQLMDFKQFLQA
jgi:hypothetical protein